MKSETRLAQFVRQNFAILPADAVSQPRAQCFQRSLLRRPTSSQPVPRIRMPQHIRPFRVSEYALSKPLAMADINFRDPLDFNDIDTDADNHPPLTTPPFIYQNRFNSLVLSSILKIPAS